MTQGGTMPPCCVASLSRRRGLHAATQCTRVAGSERAMISSRTSAGSVHSAVMGSAGFFRRRLPVCVVPSCVSGGGGTCVADHQQINAK